MAMRIGFIGLGRMGGAVTPHLMDAGFEVRGFDLDRKKVRALAARGGKAATSVRKAAAEADAVFLSLPWDRDVLEVTLGGGGLRETMRRGTIVVDMSTVLPEVSREAAAGLKKAGVSFLDAPISGNRAVTRERGGTLMVGGSRRSFERCLPAFRAFSLRQYYMGPSGAGSLTKLVVNTVSELNRAALAEGLNLGMQGGIDGDRLLEVLASGSAYSKQIDHKGERMVHGRFTDPEAIIDMCVKDADYMLKAAGDAGAWMPLTALRLQLYRAASCIGHGGHDPASVIEVYRRMTGGKGRRRAR